MKYSLIIPVYNEEKILKANLEEIQNYLKTKQTSFEIIIADDGSVDNSLHIVRALQKKHENIKVVRNIINQGRGSALTKAFSAARGEIQIYIDADLQIDYTLFDALVSEITHGKADIAIGSKHLPASSVVYSKPRRIASKCYSWLARLLFGSTIKDYQCGFKAFRYDAIRALLPHINSKRWSWDTEVLLKAQWMGYYVKEVPARVRNVYERESTVHLLKDSIAMGIFLLKLFVEKNTHKK